MSSPGYSRAHDSAVCRVISRFSVPADTPGPNWHIGLESKRHFWAVRQENPGNFMNAKEMIMKPSTIAKTLTIATVTALVLGIGPKAKADDKGCSEANLRGTFAYTSTGIIVAAPIPALVGPSAEVGTLYFDGKDGVRFTFICSQNGAVG